MSEGDHVVGYDPAEQETEKTQHEVLLGDVCRLYSFLLWLQDLHDVQVGDDGDAHSIGCQSNSAEEPGKPNGNAQQQRHNLFEDEENVNNLLFGEGVIS